MARIWFITGSSRGLGRSLAEAVLQSGDNLIATARNPSSLQPLIDQYGPSRALSVALDVTEPAQVDAAVKKGIEHFGRIDVLVNNAGYADVASVEDVSIESFKKQVDANFYGTVWVTKAVIPLMRAQGSGRIMQVSSVGSRLGSPGLAAYQSAKWAVAGLVQVLAKELTPFGIKVTSLEPGGMATDWAGSSMTVEEISEPYQQSVGAFCQLRETIEKQSTPPEKVADAIVTISKVDDPPLRLLLCPETTMYAQAVAKEVADADAKWEGLTKNLRLD